MNQLINRSLITILLLLPVSAWADFDILDARIERLLTSATDYAGYLAFRNNGDHKAEVVKVYSDSFEKIEIHRMVEQEGMFYSEQQAGLSISAEAQIILEPGGLYLRMMNPVQELKSGGKVDVWFDFFNIDPIKFMMSVI